MTKAQVYGGLGYLQFLDAGWRDEVHVIVFVVWTTLHDDPFIFYYS